MPVDFAGTNTEQCFTGAGSVIITYAPTPNMVRGATTASFTTTILIPQQGATARIYITGLQFGNTSSSTITVLLNDTAASDFIIPAGGGSNSMYLVPLVVAAGTDLTFTPSGVATTIFANAQGYIGP
jgi:hypothetical protein